MNDIVDRLETATKLAAAAKRGLTQIPTMDAQALLLALRDQPEVIRCDNCLHFEHDNKPVDGCGWCCLLERTFFGTDYCSQAVRRE